ncbi:MAG TPA: glycosyltransferase [Kiritimatiellia bacterium]|nr:glycosyltransferase [Kiritimatiellia bacterium]
MKSPPSISVVIPTLNAARWLGPLIDQLSEQQPGPPDEIILVDSGSTDGTLEIASRFPVVKVLSVTQFSHGGARNYGIREARGDVVVLMTQDAIPKDGNWLARLIQPLESDEVAAVYSRQIPRDDASPMERFFLRDRFPDGPAVVRRHQGPEAPVYPETFFSNVSSAARRDVWRRFPFDEKLLMGEDQQFARDTLMAGMALVYEPASLVYHSHTYSLTQTFKRYFDSVVAFRQLYQSHGTGTSARLGGGKVWPEIAYLFRDYPWSIPYFIFYMGFKSAGVIAGHMADRLPPSWCAKLSLHPAWWMGRSLDKPTANREDVRPHE